MSAAVDNGGRKEDGGKDPWHLAPWDAFRAIVCVLRFGANKYAPRNWERGMDWSRVYAALLRHLTDWWMGEALDPETGMSHLWHAGCCIVFLIAYEIRGVGRDDRPKREPSLDQDEVRLTEIEHWLAGGELSEAIEAERQEIILLRMKRRAILGPASSAS